MSTKAPVRCFACGLHSMGMSDSAVARISLQYLTPPFVCSTCKPGMAVALAAYQVELAAELLKWDAA